MSLRGVHNSGQMHESPHAEAICWKRVNFLRRKPALAQDRFVVPPRDDVLLCWFSVGSVAFETAQQ
jgi:hypothetical protein